MKQTAFLLAVACLAGACGNDRDYDATGIFEANTVTVSAETAGKILRLNLDEGDSLTMGQSVGIVDTTQLALRRKQLQQIAHQQEECARIGRLLADGAATGKQADDARARLNVLRGQLDALLSTLGKNRSSISENASALQYEREEVEEQLRKSRITAPLTGTVLLKYAEAGEYATPGRPLFKMADLDNVYFRCYFTASQLAHLRLGQEVTVIADFGGDEQYEYPGRVTWIAQESEFTPKAIQTRDSRANLVYAVKVAVKNDGRLKLGQYGEVRL